MRGRLDVERSTILICDDDRAHADALALGLHALGHAVEVTRSRADAFAVACAFDIDVIVAGWTLRDGSALALPASLGIRRPRLLVLASRIDERLPTPVSRRVGFDLQLTKVVEPETLDRVLRTSNKKYERGETPVDMPVSRR
jgi:DNA-binding response OmpR family regulator